MSDDARRRVFTVGPGEGESITVADVGHLFKLTGESTGGVVAVEQFTLAAGVVGARPHVHEHHDEYFWVLDGVLTVHDGTAESEVAPGTLIAARRGAPHGYRNAGDRPVGGLCVYTPAGYEGYFREVHAALESGAEASEDLLAETRRRYGSWSWPPPDGEQAAPR